MFNHTDGGLGSCTAYDYLEWDSEMYLRNDPGHWCLWSGSWSRIVNVGGYMLHSALMMPEWGEQENHIHSNFAVFVLIQTYLLVSILVASFNLCQ